MIDDRICFCCSGIKAPPQLESLRGSLDPPPQWHTVDDNDVDAAPGPVLAELANVVRQLPGLRGVAQIVPGDEDEDPEGGAA